MADVPIELSVVVPVFCEAETIAEVLVSWTRILEAMRIDYEMLVYDDGSTDGSLSILRDLERTHSLLYIRHHVNCGHGPTIRRGYQESHGKWVFQVDGDDEIGPEPFPHLWQNRHHNDLLLACRDQSSQPWRRQFVSALSHLTVRSLFGAGVTDVNAPYRLIRRGWLTTALTRIPEDTFAPNVVLSGLAVRDQLRIFEISVPRRKSQSPSSLSRSRLWIASLRSFKQTLKVARETRRPV